ncbi:hypothetical protein LOZ80_25855 [Paenibacillus sp. HWE-109]|uniref:hypothetical protein n=1 Tax=Paenibacillus sp. HWE-109 TaxID=1306526 RepID=UPI001EDEAC56|nr:hypothetical protein [Paenibacillus sp. HWE-109]UKS25006.1 hypothetical protein LOZ80_25855 [Paenibacillus sp. HWE-109]
MEMSFYFITRGCRETGDYDVFIVRDGFERKLDKHVRGNKKSGLKDARRIVASEVSAINLPYDAVVTHYCEKPGREKNPRHDWTVQDYKQLLK